MTHSMHNKQSNNSVLKLLSNCLNSRYIVKFEKKLVSSTD